MSIEKEKYIEAVKKYREFLVNNRQRDIAFANAWFRHKGLEIPKSVDYCDKKLSELK